MSRPNHHDAEHHQTGEGEAHAGSEERGDLGAAVAHGDDLEAAEDNDTAEGGRGDEVGGGYRLGTARVSSPRGAYIAEQWACRVHS